MTRTVVLLFFFAVVLGACSAGTGTGTGLGDASASSSSSGAAPSGSDLTGQWSGSWKSPTGAGGTIALTFTEQGSAVSGDVHFTGSPCFAGGLFQGTMTGHELSGTVSAGGIRTDILGTLSSRSIDGTYSVVQGGVCTGDRGTFTAAR